MSFGTAVGAWWTVCLLTFMVEDWGIVGAYGGEKGKL